MTTFHTHRKTFRLRIGSGLIGLVCAWGLALNVAPVGAAQKALDEETIKRIEQRILTDLKTGPWLQEQIEQGIQNHAKKGQEAQEAARAEFMRQAAEKAKSVRPVDQARDHIYGKPDAPLSLIEYSDFECPYCKQFHAIPKALVDASEGRLNWVYRHFPLGFHNPVAQKEAEASECANQIGAQKAFWAFTDAAYARTQSNGKGFELIPLAKELGLAEADFQQCLDNGKFAARVNQDLEEGVNSGITGTPGIILRNNRTGEVRLKPGLAPAAAFKTDIEQMLSPHPAPKK